MAGLVLATGRCSQVGICDRSGDARVQDHCLEEDHISNIDMLDEPDAIWPFGHKCLPGPDSFVGRAPRGAAPDWAEAFRKPTF
jgi:hypothetical protein